MLGGGQLGRMLLQKAADFSLNFKVLDPDPAAPCRYLSEEFFTGSFSDYDTVYAFGKTCDLITIEIEHVNVHALTQLENEGVLVFPQPSVIALVQDKGSQKLFFQKNNIPSAPFVLTDNRSALTKNHFEFPYIQKLRRGGYDGKGVMKISSQDDLQTGFDDPSLVEKMIDFKKEIAVIVARNQEGDCRCFPAVEMQFNPVANLVEFLFSPADISAETGNNAKQIAMNVANALQIVGVLAVEMFLTHDEEILVNEIAPRPHNSGHHTIEANVTSQYEQHLRAILNLPLGSAIPTLPAVMVNLLGEENHDGAAHYLNIEKVMAMEGVHVHLYGKKYTRPFRKMGHVTITGKTIHEAREKAHLVQKLLKVISI